MRRLLLALPLSLLAFACGTADDDRGLFSTTKGGAAGSVTAGSSAAGTGSKAGSSAAGSGTANNGGTGTAGASGSGTAGSGTGNTAGSGTGNTAGTGTGNNGGSGTGNTAGTGTGNTAGTGTGNAGGSGPVVAPTDCATAHGVIGCCSPDGKTNYWFGSGQLNVETCKDGQVCGWSTQASYYVCITGSIATADPSGKYPLSCGLPQPPDTCNSGTGGSGTAGSPGMGGSGPNPFGGAPPQGGSSSGVGGSGTAGGSSVVCAGMTCEPAFPGLPACCSPDGKCGIELQPGMCVPF